jgi:hypothetical protein
MRQIIYWGFPNSQGAGADPSFLLIYNYAEDRFTWANQTHFVLLETGEDTVHEYGQVTGFNGSFDIGTFSATAGTAILATGDMEFNEGGRAYVDGVKPHIESSGTAPAVSVRIGTRNDLGTAPSYTSATSLNSRTGYANFRADAKYHRSEVTIVGNFEKTTGMNFNARPSGKA